MNSDADETLAKGENRYVSEVLPHTCRRIYVESLLCNFFRSNMQAYIHRLHIYTDSKNTLLFERYTTLAKLKKV